MPPSSPFAELYATSNYSFLEGASHPEELVQGAAALGYKAIGIADRHTLAGIVRGYQAAKQVGIQFVVGARLDLFTNTSPKDPDPALLSLLAYPTSRTGYGNLCSILTTGKLRAEKDACRIVIDDIVCQREDLIFVLLPPGCDNQAILRFNSACTALQAHIHREHTFLACTYDYSAYAAAQREITLQLATQHRLPLVATNAPHFHTPKRKPLHDVLSCIRNHCTVASAGFRLQQNSERYLKAPLEMLRLFRESPAAIEHGLWICERAEGFSLDALRYEYPHEACPEGHDALTYLRQLVEAGAHERYPRGVPTNVRETIEHELRLIHELQYEKYFLTCHDIVRFARHRQILCQGRGAAANSAVCYCLGITSVDPARIELLVERFISKERSEPPDIDIDFEHERREEVIQYIYQRFGRHRAALVSEVITYQRRSALREVGKVLGLPLDVLDQLTTLSKGWEDAETKLQDLQALGLNPNDPTIQNTLALSSRLRDFPRHLSQHVGGFIISEQPLSRTVPILNARMAERTTIEWDKDDVEALGMLKIDVLALGMLSALRRALQFINTRRLETAEEPLQLYSIPAEAPEVYDMLGSADSVGVFQIESRAQMSMLPRLKPKNFYDLVIEVAIVRPGPIQGNMVHPFLRRRAGIEKVHFPDVRVEKILGKTLGVPLFQEQAMRLAITLANFTPGEAEQLRRAMAAWKRNKGKIATFRKRILEGMVQNGYTLAFAESCFNQIRGFSEYGFPESHAASFALLVYASAWIKRFHPAAFTAALINSQPMGFYQPAQLIRDAEMHGVPVLPIDVNDSGWDCSVEHSPSPLRGGSENTLTAESREKKAPGIRLGMRLIRGVRKEEAEKLSEAIKQHGRFSSMHDLWLTVNGKGVFKKTLLRLAEADAFRSMGLRREEAIWNIRALPPEITPIDQHDRGAPLSSNELAFLPKASKQLSMFNDYQATGLSLRAHPLQFLRESLTSRGAETASQLLSTKSTRYGTMVSTAGLVLVRQRPHTAKGVTFITLEDETGTVNLIVRPEVYARYRRLILTSQALLVRGKIERTEAILYLNVSEVRGIDLELLSLKSRDFC